MDRILRLYKQTADIVLIAPDDLNLFLEELKPGVEPVCTKSSLILPRRKQF